MVKLSTVLPDRSSDSWLGILILLGQPRRGSSRPASRPPELEPMGRANGTSRTVRYRE